MDTLSFSPKGGRGQGFCVSPSQGICLGIVLRLEKSIIRMLCGVLELQYHVSNTREATFAYLWKYFLILQTW